MKDERKGNNATGKLRGKRDSYDILISNDR